MRMVFEYCERHGKVVMFHTGCDPYVWEYPEFSEDANPKHLEPMIRRFKNVPVILAHMGSYSARSPGVWLNEALRLGRLYKNVWFDISAVTYVVTEQSFIDQVRKAVGMNHILFGSDYPAIQGVSIKSMVSKVENSPYLTKDEKAGILGLNAINLLDL